MALEFKVKIHEGNEAEITCPNGAVYRKYFPPEFTPEQIKVSIENILDGWRKSRIN